MLIFLKQFTPPATIGVAKRFQRSARRLAIGLCFLSLLCADSSLADDVAGPVRWDMDALAKPPTYTSAPIDEPGLQAIFYDGLPLQGKPTRVFAWLGVPKDAPQDHKTPAMVLVHGGGGTAHARWVRLWNARGYAAIAMDTCGAGLAALEPNQKRLDDGGPPGWGASFEQLDRPIADQWGYHAIADIILANSLLRSLPEVDADHIGLTGISWGGYLTCIAAGVDSRFRFAAPVYGCGFLGDDSGWKSKFEQMGPDLAGKWLSLWDPSVYLPHAKMPLLWVSGDLDRHYPLGSLKKSYHLPPGERYLAVRHNMPHGHPAGETPPEIWALAQQQNFGAPSLARMTEQGADHGTAWGQVLLRRAARQSPVHRHR